jgi:hypothetical protein
MTALIAVDSLLASRWLLLAVIIGTALLPLVSCWRLKRRR